MHDCLQFGTTPYFCTCSQPQHKEVGKNITGHVRHAENGGVPYLHARATDRVLEALYDALSCVRCLEEVWCRSTCDIGRHATQRAVW